MAIQKTSDAVVNVNEITRIAKGVSLKGDLISPTDIRVDGTIDGKIFSGGRVVVGESANILGTVMCTHLDLWGKMEGEVYVKDTVSLKSSGIVTGNLNVRRIQVEIGAQINGSCHMITEDEFDKSAAKIMEMPAPRKTENKGGEVKK